MIADVVFWAAVALVLYAYLGYPAALMALLLVRDRRVAKAPVRPSVTFIITAYNEERRIREKLENTLGQDYPTSRLEIIVASDCSTDRTDEIVGSHAARVRLIRPPERLQHAAQRRGDGPPRRPRLRERGLLPRHRRRPPRVPAKGADGRARDRRPRGQRADAESRALRALRLAAAEPQAVPLARPARHAGGPRQQRGAGLALDVLPGAPARPGGVLRRRAGRPLDQDPHPDAAVLSRGGQPRRADGLGPLRPRRADHGLESLGARESTAADHRALKFRVAADHQPARPGKASCN